jgi:hypothetical protein
LLTLLPGCRIPAACLHACRPYNELHAWDYCRLADAMDNGSGALLAIKVRRLPG